MPIHFDQVNLVTGDMEASVDFYRLIGLAVDEPLPDWTDWAPHHRSIEGESVSFEIDSRSFTSAYWASQEFSGGVVLTFRVDTREEVDAYYERVTAAGHRGLKTPFDAFWGARYALVLDPSGVAIGFMSPGDPKRRFEPPDPSTFR